MSVLRSTPMTVLSEEKGRRQTRCIVKHFAEVPSSCRFTNGRDSVVPGLRAMGGQAAVKQAYREVLKLVKRLPPPARGYYTQYARENFVTYSEAQDAASIGALLARAHHHTCWILKKVREFFSYSVHIFILSSVCIDFGCVSCHLFSLWRRLFSFAFHIHRKFLAQCHMRKKGVWETLHEWLEESLVLFEILWSIFSTFSRF